MSGAGLEDVFLSTSLASYLDSKLLVFPSLVHCSKICFFFVIFDEVGFSFDRCVSCYFQLFSCWCLYVVFVMVDFALFSD